MSFLGLLRHLLVGCGAIIGLLFCVSSFPKNTPHIAYDADIYFVPIGPVPKEALHSLAEHYRRLASFKVEITAALPIPDEAIDLVRRQLIAEKTHAILGRIFAPGGNNPAAIVIGISAYDMYIEGSNWKFAFSYGTGGVAIVSDARLKDGATTEAYWSERLLLRMRKLLSKRIAVRALETGTLTSPFSTLRTPILSADDLDKLDARELDQALTAASLSKAVSSVRADTVEPVPQTADWKYMLVIVITIVVMCAMIYW